MEEEGREESGAERDEVDRGHGSAMAHAQGNEAMREVILVADEDGLPEREADDDDGESVVDRDGEDDERGDNAGHGVEAVSGYVEGGEDGEDGEGVADEHAAGIAHEHGGGGEVEKEKAGERADEDEEHCGDEVLLGQDGDGGEGGGGDEGDAGAQAVHVVEQVEGVGDGDDPADGDKEREPLGGDEGGDSEFGREGPEEDGDGGLDGEADPGGEAPEIVEETEDEERRAAGKDEEDELGAGGGAGDVVEKYLREPGGGAGSGGDECEQRGGEDGEGGDEEESDAAAERDGLGVNLAFARQVHEVEAAGKSADDPAEEGGGKEGGGEQGQGDGNQVHRSSSAGAMQGETRHIFSLKTRIPAGAVQVNGEGCMRWTEWT